MKKLLILLIALFFNVAAFADVEVVNGDGSDQAISNTASAQTDKAASTDSLPIKQRVTILEQQVTNLTQLLSQVTQLQQQMQDLQGKIEVENHDLKQLQDQVKAQYQDLDSRLTQNKSSPQKKAKPISQNKVEADSDSTDQDDSDDSAQTSADDDGDQSASSGNTAPDHIIAPDQKAYQQAVVLLKNKQYSQASVAFKKFIKQYPNSQNNVNAHYWLGQLYLLQGQPEQAIDQFQGVIAHHPKDAKVPDTMVQLGLAYYAKGDLQKARSTLKKVQTQYPGTAAAKLAAKRLQQMTAHTPG